MKDTKEERDKLIGGWKKSALALIEKKFKDKKDCGGQPYIGHLIRVARRVADEKFVSVSDNFSTLAFFYEKAYIVALLHDIIEDTDVTTLDLLNEGFDNEIVDAVDAITRREGEQYYMDFIERVSKNDIARLVKICDLEDNMDITRLKVFGEYEQKRLKKYWYSWKFLKKEITLSECYDAIHPNRLYN
jgi:(p)ppGpp synthase/HD superfamily hydrolase